MVFKVNDRERTSNAVHSLTTSKPLRPDKNKTNFEIWHAIPFIINQNERMKRHSKPQNSVLHGETLKLTTGLMIKVKITRTESSLPEVPKTVEYPKERYKWMQARIHLTPSGDIIF